MSKAKQPRRRLSWDEWYRLAKRYRDAHGDLLIPRDYVSPEGAKLGRWIERQRARYNAVPSAARGLYPDEIALLDELGMVWKLEYRHDWDDWLGALDGYRRVHGDANIPKSYVHGSYALGNWVVEQRKARAAGRLTEREIADLDARDMLWNVGARRRSWDEWFEDARAYYEAHGDLAVSPEYVTEGGDRLGLWVYAQRDIRAGRKGDRALTPEQAARLESVGMVWEPEALKSEAWDRMYAWIAEYRQAHGRLPLWPRSMKAPDGRSMSGWIATQRTALARGSVAPERASRLRAIGIEAPQSTEQRDDAWDRMYAAVADYFRENGSLPPWHRDLRAPDGRQMPRWIQAQRRALQAGGLSQDRIERLARLGIVGSV